jgi:ribokinase
MKPRRPTIRDVATAAGVSTGTVSNVLTGRRAVQPDTRHRIEAAIASLGYTPDLAARALIGRRGRAAPAHDPAVPRLTCVGYLCADHVAHLGVLPHRADRVTAAGIEKKLGGRAANVAVTVAGLGPPWPVAVDLLSVLGLDAESDWAEALLAERRVRLLPASRVAGGRLSRCFIMVEPDGSRTIVNEPLQVGPAALRAWRAAVDEQRRPALFVQGDQLATLAPVLAEPGFRGLFTATQLGQGEAGLGDAAALERLARQFSLVVVNHEAARRRLGAAGGTADLIERVMAALRSSGGRVALTLGPEGAVLFEQGRLIARATAPAVEVVDETGAGDTFTGTLIAALLHRTDPAMALAAAVRAGSLAVTVSGAQEHGLTAVTLGEGLGMVA